MPLLEVNQSYYIISQQKFIGCFTIFIFIAVIAFFLYLLKKEIISPIRKKIEVITLAGIPIFLLLYVFYFFPQFKMTFQLENNYKETLGVTIRYIHEVRAQPWVEYKYVVKGTTYIKRGEIIYDGEEIPNLIYPNGQYIVIYDSLNPGNSEMDFKRVAN